MFEQEVKQKFKELKKLIEELNELMKVTDSKMDVKVPPPFVFSDIDLSSVKGEIPNYSLYENH